MFQSSDYNSRFTSSGGAKSQASLQRTIAVAAGIDAFYSDKSITEIKNSFKDKNIAPVILDATRNKTVKGALAYALMYAIKYDEDSLTSVKEGGLIRGIFESLKGLYSDENPMENYKALVKATTSWLNDRNQWTSNLRGREDLRRALYTTMKLAQRTMASLYILERSAATMAGCNISLIEKEISGILESVEKIEAAPAEKIKDAAIEAHDEEPESDTEPVSDMSVRSRHSRNHGETTVTVEALSANPIRDDELDADESDDEELDVMPMATTKKMPEAVPVSVVSGDSLATSAKSKRTKARSRFGDSESEQRDDGATQTSLVQTPTTTSTRSSGGTKYFRTAPKHQVHIISPLDAETLSTQTSIVASARKTQPARLSPTYLGEIKTELTKELRLALEKLISFKNALELVVKKNGGTNSSEILPIAEPNIPKKNLTDIEIAIAKISSIKKELEDPEQNLDGKFGSWSSFFDDFKKLDKAREDVVKIINESVLTKTQSLHTRTWAEFFKNILENIVSGGSRSIKSDETKMEQSRQSTILSMQEIKSKLKEIKLTAQKPAQEKGSEENTALPPRTR